MNHQLDTIFTVTETAKYLKISKTKMYNLVKAGEIPHLKIGKNVRIRETDLVKWMESQFKVQNPDL